MAETKTSVSTPVAAKVAEVTLRMALHWASTGLVAPSAVAHKGDERDPQSPGKGVHRRYDLADLVALRAVAKLRRKGVSLQACRRIQADLNARVRPSAKLLAIRGNPANVLLVTSAREEREALAESLLKRPGEMVALTATLSVGEIEREVKRGLVVAIRDGKARRRKALRKARENRRTAKAVAKEKADERPISAGRGEANREVAA